MEAGGGTGWELEGAEGLFLACLCTERQKKARLGMLLRDQGGHEGCKLASSSYQRWDSWEGEMEEWSRCEERESSVKN